MKIEVNNPQKSFEKGDLSVDVIKGVDFIIQSGETVAITGPSGSGKTTLLQIIGLLDSPTSGSVSINGKNETISKESRKASLRNQYFGFVYQFHHLIPEFTAIENVMMPLIIKGENETNSKQEAKKILKAVKIFDRSQHFPNELSGGEQQRVAIARALIAGTNLILADEPTGNLDYKTSKEIFSYFLKLKKLKKTIIFATHNRELANRADYKLLISNGDIKRVNAR